MSGLLCFFLAVVASLFKSKLRLEAENAVLRHQLIVLRRRLQVASSSRTMIAVSLSSCIAGFR
jgi:IS1 family transposase